MRFEWDETKRASNIAKHGIDFIRARVMFDGRPALDLQSRHPAESRLLRIALVDGEMLTAIWTRRPGSAVRIISVRKSRNEEKRAYRQLHL